MGADLIAKIAEHGTLGVFLAIAMVIGLKLYQALERERQGRLTDAQKSIVDQAAIAASHLIRAERMVEACTAAITAQTHVTEGHRTGLNELHDALREYVDEMRTYSNNVEKALSEFRVRMDQRR